MSAAGTPTATSARRILIKVVQQYGANGAAARLSVSPAVLGRLLAGLTAVPDSLLMRAIDLLPEAEQPIPAPSPDAPSRIAPSKSP